MFRALRVSLTCNDLCDILSRLVETVAEQGEDMQVRLYTKCFFDMNEILSVGRGR